MTDKVKFDALAFVESALNNSNADEEKYDVLIGREFNRFDANDEKTLDEFKAGVLDGSIAYEALFGEVVPYHDYDEKVPTGDLQEADKSAYKKCIAALREVWGPDAEIYAYTSTGIKKSLDPTKYSGPFVSQRYILPNVGKFASGAHLKLSGRVPAIFDQGVYKDVGMRQLMRVWGGSKEGENRPLKIILNGVPKTLKEVNDEDPTIASHLFRMSLAQNVGNQKLIEVKMPDVAPTLKVGDKVVALGKNGLPLGDDIKIDCIAQVRELYVIAKKFEEVNRTYDVYRDLIFGVGNIGKECGFDINEVRTLAHELAAVCPNNNPRNVDKLFNKTWTREINQTRKHLGHLRDEATKKNEVAYANWVKPLKVARNEADPLMKELDKLDWKNDKIAKFKGPIMKAALEWVSMMRKAGATDEIIDHHASARMERMKLAHLPVNRRLYLSDTRFLHLQYIKGDKLLKEFPEDTMIAVINGGETIWITADYVESQQTPYIKELAVCPMSHKSEVIVVYCVNIDWVKDIDDKIRSLTDEGCIEAYLTNSIVTRKFVDDFAQGYRKTHFAQLTGHFPYLNESQKPNSTEVFNLFGGFRYQYEPRSKFKFAEYPKEIEPFIRHIYDIMANGNTHIGNYLLVWFAFLLQFPARKPEMALFFISIEGAGKGIVFESFAKYVMGENHFIALKKIDDLIDHFNAHLEGKRLVTVAETKDGDLANKETHRALKNAITDERTVFTKKGKDPHTAMSYNAIAMFGNSSGAISIDTGDRRLFPIQMSNARIGDMAYFDALSDNMKDNGYKIFDFLANLDLTGYDVRHPSMVNGQRVAENQFRMQLVEDSLPESLQYIVSIARHEQKHQFVGAQAMDLPEVADTELRCQKEDLYKAYSTWYGVKHSNETKYLCKPKKFFEEFDKLGLKNEKRSWKDANGDTNRSWCYQFNYSQVRSAFRALLKNPEYDF